MTASPTPPPATLHRPGAFEGPVWGWVLALGLAVWGVWLGVFRNAEAHAVYPGPKAYVAAQVEPTPPASTWIAVAEWFGEAGATKVADRYFGVPSLVFLAFLLLLLISVGLGRYNALPFLLAVGPWALLGYAAARRFWISTRSG